MATEKYPSGRVVTQAYAGSGTNPLQYAANGALRVTPMGNGLVEESCFNARFQVTGIRVGTAAVGDCVTPAGSDKLNLVFDYGAAGTNNGNILSQTVKVNSLAVQNMMTYGYDDPAGRLKSYAGTLSPGFMECPQP